MSIDPHSATSFMATHARLLDRRRFEFVIGEGDPAALTAALDAYRNPDGGYGWGLEPDLGPPESQPGGALHALEAIEAIAPRTTPRAAELCEWLASVTLADGGLPFALPVADTAGLAPHALALLARVQLLDAAHAAEPEAATLLERLGERIPVDGRVHVAGGKEDETVGALDFAPNPGRPGRELFSTELIAAELERLSDEQSDDGGWPVDFENCPPAATLEWRGYMTVRAVSILWRK